MLTLDLLLIEQAEKRRRMGLGLSAASAFRKVALLGAHTAHTRIQLLLLAVTIVLFIIAAAGAFHRRQLGRSSRIAFEILGGIVLILIVVLKITVGYK